MRESVQRGEAEAPERNVARLDFDPYGRDFLSDPISHYDRLLDAGSAFWIGKYGVWGVARYEHVRAAFENWEVFSSAAGIGLSDFRKEKPWRPPSLIAEADPPLHTQSRSVLAKVLSPAAMRSLKPAFLARAEGLVDGLLQKRSFDAITELCEVYPADIMAEYLGIPSEARNKWLIKYGALAVAAFGPRNWLFDEAMADLPEAQRWVAACTQRSALRNDGFGEQIYQAADRGEIPQDHAPILVRSLLTAGIDNVIITLGNMLLAFARNPAQWELLRENPALWRQAFDETLRYDSPVLNFYRTTTRSANVGDVDLGEGQKVLLFMGAANRDPRKWERPDQFDITRNTQGHLGLGAGIHACVGQMMARLEAECLLTTLIKRVASIELAGEPVPQLNNNTKGYASVPVRVQLQ